LPYFSTTKYTNKQPPNQVFQEELKRQLASLNELMELLVLEAPSLVPILSFTFDNC
jgi:hypothetical protein